MWLSGWFSHKGRFWDIEERNVLPKPLQKPHPPIWVACQQPATFPIAGRKGIGALCFTIGKPGELKERIQSYREAVANPTEQVGKLKNDQVAAFTVAACDENDLAARELAGPQGAWYFDTIRKIYDPAWQKRAKGVPASQLRLPCPERDPGRLAAPAQAGGHELQRPHRQRLVLHGQPRTRVSRRSRCTRTRASTRR